jgi:hypothetical protein
MKGDGATPLTTQGLEIWNAISIAAALRFIFKMPTKLIRPAGAGRQIRRIHHDLRTGWLGFFVSYST